MRHCPTCDEEIDDHLDVCPWCGRPTGFNNKKGLREKAVRWLDVAQRNKKYLISGAIGIVIIIVALLLVFSRPAQMFGEKKLATSEVLDSFAAVIPEGSNVVARFSDNRHALYYLNSGHLMKFNAETKMLDEVDLTLLNGDAIVYYNDREMVQGILDATLSTDEKDIVLTVVAERPQAGQAPKTMRYRLNTESMNLHELGPVVTKPQAEKADSVKRYRKKAEPTETEEAAAEEATPATAPAENTPAKEPSPAQSAGEETVIVPANQ